MLFSWLSKIFIFKPSKEFMLVKGSPRRGDIFSRIHLKSSDRTYHNCTIVNVDDFEGKTYIKFSLKSPESNQKVTIAANI